MKESVRWIKLFWGTRTVSKKICLHYLVYLSTFNVWVYSEIIKVDEL